jgi:hypothetical protein
MTSRILTNLIERDWTCHRASATMIKLQATNRAPLACTI